MAAADRDETLVVLDKRKRAPLGRLADREQYLARRETNGRIILEPAVTLTEAELALREDEAFWGRVAKTLDEPVTAFEL